MFTVHVSCLPTLQIVAQYCSVPLVAFINEFAPDNTALYGIEIHLPLLFPCDVPRRLFFWSDSSVFCLGPYEHAAFQTINCLQNLYGFTVLDYNSESMLTERRLLQCLYLVPNRGAHLARMVLTVPQSETSPNLQLFSIADQLIQDIDSMINPGLL
ncbi:hypothetical protein SORBI_3004G230400 [Sorghum bicolor]|uniref:Uncharacterized protein n=1 Tax=Sorghum bicolor TaxID=4558 RepID=A0A194YR59_SORBI|nr:hypothetical protein SORBI_3004G230400 [Sorghum bicolor]